MGCGRVGSSLARSLEHRGHTVAIIDQNVEAFRRLGPEFDGQTVKGVGFDREVLVESGIEEAGAFAAVSNGDNSNILAARVVRETFDVHNVVARIYDPGRAEIYQRLRDLCRRRRGDDGLRHEQVVGGVVGRRVPVDRTGRGPGAGRGKSSSSGHHPTLPLAS